MNPIAIWRQPFCSCQFQIGAIRIDLLVFEQFLFQMFLYRLSGIFADSVKAPARISEADALPSSISAQQEHQLFDCQFAINTSGFLPFSSILENILSIFNKKIGYFNGSI